MLKHWVAGVDFPLDCDKYCTELQDLKTLVGLEKLTLVHVLGGSYPNIPATTHQQDYLEKLQAYAKIIQKKLALTEVNCRVETGLPASQLNAIAQEVKADGITILFQNHSKVHEFFLGSVALDIARTTRFPLLLLTKQPEPATGTVMLATDGSQAAKAAEKTFTELLEASQKGVVVNVRTPKDEDSQLSSLQALTNQLKSTDKVNFIQLEGGRPSQAIIQASEQQAADLVVLGQRGQNPLAQLLLGSTAERICREIKRPVLLVPTSKESR